jgi:SsrA-binding protein
MVILKNRRARYEFSIKSTVEAGISLLGLEVKSLRAGQGSIIDSYVIENNGEMFLQNCSIPMYKFSRNSFSSAYEPRRLRKLLLKKKEIRKYSSMLTMKGMTIVPLSLYSNKRGMIKLEIGIAEGKKMHDKRAAEKEREWKKEKSTILRENKY